MKKLIALTLMLVCCSAYALSFVSKSLVTNGNMNASIASIGIDTNQLQIGGIQVVYTGSPVGNIVVQVSNQQVAVAPGADPAANVTLWDTVTGSQTAITSAGSFSYDISNIGAKWMRVAYVRSSGTGTLNVVFTGKGWD